MFKNLEDRVAWTCASILAILIIAASFAPDNFRVWGLDGLAYSGNVSVIISFAVILAVSLSSRFFLPFLTSLTQTRISTGLTVVLFIGLATLLLPSATFLRGDGQLLINHLLIDQPASFRSPLYSYIVGLVFHTGRPFGITPHGTYIIIDTIAVFVYFLAVLRLTKFFKQAETKIAVFLLFLFSGSIPLFFGLVEHYALLHAVLAWVLVLAIESKEQNRFPWISLVLNIFAISLHFSAVTTLPAFILLMKNGKSRNLWIIFSAVGIVALVIAAFFFKRHILWPLGLPASDGYSLYSLNHIIDLINLDFWSVPVLLAVAFPVIISSKAEFGFNMTAQFLLAALLSTAGFVVIFSPDLGMARDVDLLAIYCLPATVFVVYLLYKSNLKLSYSIISAIVFVGLISVGMQVLSQGNEQKSVNRFTRLLRIDEERSAYGYEVLAMYYRFKGNAKAEEESYRQAILHDEHPRYLVRLGQILVKTYRYEEAEKFARKAIKKDSTFALAYGLMGEVFKSQSQQDEAENYFYMAIEIEPDLIVHYANLGAYLADNERFEEAEKVILDGLDRAEPNGQIYYVYGLILHKEGKLSNALNYLEKCKNIDPYGEWGARATKYQNRLLIAPIKTD